METFFRKKDMEFVKKYMGDEIARRWEGLEQKQNNAGVVTIANTGLYSSGKSSLFNALLDQIENERFPVGAIPTTKAGDRERLSEYVEIIDTPGIDATYEDDEVAVNMLMESDIILITHNIKMGMLNQSEYTWICKEVGLLTLEGNYIIGGAFETEETVWESIEHAKRLLELGRGMLELSTVFFHHTVVRRLQKIQKNLVLQ